LKQNTRIEDNATLKKKNTIQWCYFLDYYGMKDIHPYLILQLQEEEWLVLQYRVLWRGGAGVIPSIGAANLELFETFKCMAHSLLRVNPLLFFFLGGGFGFTIYSWTPQKFFQILSFIAVFDFLMH
jgi:hypothetical protein